MLGIKGLLDIYSNFLISQNGKATATSLSAMYDGKISHDKITRLLNKNSFGSKELWELVKPLVKKENGEAVLAVDDTIVDKPYTDENDIVCYHYSHGKKRIVKGIEFISCAAIYDNMTLPVCYEIIEKTEQYENKKKEMKRRSADTKNKRFTRLLEQAVACGLDFSYVLADNWFGSKDNLNFIHNSLGKKFIIGIKSNRLVSLQQKGQFLSLNSLHLENGSAITVYLKGLNFPVQLLKQVFTNEDGSSGTLYLVTNDTGILANKILEIYKKRWKIEEFHKSFKNNASAAKSPTKTRVSQANHIFASLLAFCKLETLKLSSSIGHFAIKASLTNEANKASLLALSKLLSLSNHRDAYASA
jgi:hypothetical protein